MLGASGRTVPVHTVAKVVTRASLRRGRHPPPGPQLARYNWNDLLDGAPPRRRLRGGGTYVVYHGTEHGPNTRFSFSTIVHVDPGDDLESAHDDVMTVDERINVQGRPLQDLIEREREFSDTMANRWRSRLTGSLVGQRRAASRLPRAILPAALLLIRIQAQIGFSMIAGARALLRGIVDVPDTIITRTVSAMSHLSTRMGRRNLRQALRDPGRASPQEKGVVLLLVGGGLVSLLLVLNSLFALVFVGGARAYQRLVGDFSASLASVLALPIPAEPLLILSVVALGPALGMLGLYAGKMVGSWILYILGDTLFDVVNAKTEGRPRLTRFVKRLQRGADRTGFWWLTAINAVPLVPDVLVYAFAVSGMRYRAFIGGIALGTLLKFAAIVAAVVIVGPERVTGFLSDPLAHWRSP